MKKFMNSGKAAKLAPFAHDKLNPDMIIRNPRTDKLKKKSPLAKAFGK